MFEETDPGYRCGVDQTQSEAFILIVSGDHVTSEIQFLPADNPTAPLHPATREELLHLARQLDLVALKWGKQV